MRWRARSRRHTLLPPSQIAIAELESAGALAPCPLTTTLIVISSAPHPLLDVPFATGPRMAPKKMKSKSGFKGVLVREFGR